MGEILTYNLLKRFQALLIVCVVVCCSSFTNKIGNGSFHSSDLQAKTIKCYPNPAISYVNFELPDNYLSKDYLLQVYSFTGKKMYEFNVNSAKATLTFNNQFYRGIYVYQLQDKAGRVIETGKFQVTR